MVLFNIVRLTPRRILLLLVASLVAASAAFAMTASRSSTHSSTAIIFTSQLLRDNRTDGQLQNLVDDLLLATELTTVTDAVAIATGLEHDEDYTVLADRVIDDGDTIEITTTSENRADAETAARAVGQAAFNFIVGQDIAQASVAQVAANTAVTELTVELEKLEAEAGGISPVVLHDQAQADLAVLITARGTSEAPTVEEIQLLGRVAQLSTPRRQYLQLEAQLANHRDIELQELQASYQADVVLASLGTDIVIKNAEENSQLSLVIQTVLLAVLATMALALTFFALLDRRLTAQQGAPVGRRTSQQQGLPKPTSAARSAKRTKAKKNSATNRRSAPDKTASASTRSKDLQATQSDVSKSRVKANGSDRDSQNPSTRPTA